MQAIKKVDEGGRWALDYLQARLYLPAELIPLFPDKSPEHQSPDPASGLYRSSNPNNANINDNEQLAAFVAVAYVVLVLVITAITARVFTSLKPSAWFATPSLAEPRSSRDSDLSTARSASAPTILV